MASLSAKGNWQQLYPEASWPWLNESDWFQSSAESLDYRSSHLGFAKKPRRAVTFVAFPDENTNIGVSFFLYDTSNRLQNRSCEI